MEEEDDDLVDYIFNDNFSGMKYAARDINERQVFVVSDEFRKLVQKNKLNVNFSDQRVTLFSS